MATNGKPVAAASTAADAKAAANKPERLGVYKPTGTKVRVTKENEDGTLDLEGTEKNMGTSFEGKRIENPNSWWKGGVDPADFVEGSASTAPAALPPGPTGPPTPAPVK